MYPVLPPASALIAPSHYFKLSLNDSSFCAFHRTPVTYNINRTLSDRSSLSSEGFRLYFLLDHSQRRPDTQRSITYSPSRSRAVTPTRATVGTNRRDITARLRWKIVFENTASSVWSTCAFRKTDHRDGTHVRAWSDDVAAVGPNVLVRVHAADSAAGRRTRTGPPAEHPCGWWRRGVADAENGAGSREKRARKSTHRRK